MLDYFPLTRNEYEKIKQQLEYETNMEEFGDNPNKKEDFQDNLKKRVKHYCQKQYKKQKETKNLIKSNTVCMRENSFYVDTVRAFRDRRYTYKGLVKTWKGHEAEAKTPVEVQEAKDRQTLYDSLQLAHKVILNSFYG